MADDKEQPPKPSGEIDLYYRKAPDHRNVHADGVWAGVTPQLDVQMAFFAELQPMPDRIRHKVVGGTLGPEVAKDVELGVIRETQVTVRLNVITAVQMINLLKGIIDNLKKRLPEEVRQELDKAINQKASKVITNVSGT